MMFPSPQKQQKHHNNNNKQRSSRGSSRSRRREHQLTRSMQQAHHQGEQQQQQQQFAANFSDDTGSVSSRRTNRFARISDHTKQRSSSSMNRTRQHAKQIAMALTSQETKKQKQLRHEQQPSFADFGSAFDTNTTAEQSFADFAAFPTPPTATAGATSNKPRQQVAPQPSSSNRGTSRRTGDNDRNNSRKTTTTTLASANNFAAFPVTTPTSSSKKQKNKRGGSSAVATPQKQSDPFADFNTSTAADVFSDPGVEWPAEADDVAPVIQQQPRASSTASGIAVRRSSSKKKKQQQMITMQPQPTQQQLQTPEKRSHSHQQQQQQQTAVAPTSAAARRRMRKNMRGGTSESFADTSTATPVKRRDDSFQQNQLVVRSSNQVVQSSPQQQQQQQQQPRNNHRSADHVVNYSTTTPTTTSPTKSAKKQPSVQAVAPVDNNRNRRAQQRKDNKQSEPWEVVQKKSSGFSFDAFGLDGAEIQQQVNEAMNDIDFNLDDFAKWDSSTNDSSGSTNHEQADGFENGFKVTKVASASPHSERSSLTSESHDNNNNGGRINMFKQQAGFHTSKRADRKEQPPLRNQTVQQAKQVQPPPRLPQVPNLEPPPTTTARKRQDAVEFYDEDASASSSSAGEEPIFSSPNHPLASGGIAMTQKKEEHPGSEVGVPSDVGVSSDVCVTSDFAVNNHQTTIDSFPPAFADGVIEFKEKKKSSSVRTESTAATTTACEEKKEEDIGLHEGFGNLRSKWETRGTTKAGQEEEERRRRERQNQPSPLPREHIAKLEQELGSELLSPEKLMEPERMNQYKAEQQAKQQEERVRQEQQQQQQQSYSKDAVQSCLPRNKVTSARSEGGAATRQASVKAILNNLERRESSSSSARSDVGIGTQLRKTPGTKSPRNQPVASSPRHSNAQSDSSGFESQAMRMLRQQGQLPVSPSRRQSPRAQSEGSQVPASPSRRQSPRAQSEGSQLPASPSRRQSPRAEFSNSPKHALSPTANKTFSPNDKGTYVQQEMPEQRQRPLTYKERREIELREQREDEERRVAGERKMVEPERDVASLIRRRIAASKSNISSSSQEMDTAEPANENRSSPALHSKRPFDEPQEDDSHLPTHNQSESDPVGSPGRVRAMPNQPPAQVQGPPLDNSGTSSDDLNPPSTIGKAPPASAAVAHMLMMQQIQRRPRDEQQNEIPRTPSRPSSQNSFSVSSASHLRVSTGSPLNKSHDEHHNRTPKATKMMLNAFLAGRESIASSDGNGQPQIRKCPSEETPDEPVENSGLPALKDDPKYSRYFKMLSVGMPMDVVKHAMIRDGLDPDVMDGDHNKPVGIPLKDDPEYQKYFRMLKIGLPMEAVKHSMERDGLNSSVMDQDHDLPAATGKKSQQEEPKEKDSHRRARLHWNALGKVTSNSLWARIDEDVDLNIEIDENEFKQLFQAEKNSRALVSTSIVTVQKRGSSVCVIDPKRANNGGIILARLKMSHDDLADAVERIEEDALTAEQIENIIEYLPTKDERKALEAYMLEGGQDAGEKFDGLCECEKFMVSMMTVKHAKRKVSALLFKLQFESCINDIQKEASLIENACQQLSSSARLRSLLGIILTFGNRLNTAGNGKRKVGAFTLDSLLKLNQAKAFDKKTTFLHYIILIVRRNDKPILDFKEDLPTVFEADKISWDQCVADLEEVENQLENVRKIALYQAKQTHNYGLRRKSKRDDSDESMSEDDEALTLEEEVEALRATPIGLFTLSAIKYVSALRDQVEATKVNFARLLEYFGEDEGQVQPHELFSTIVTFCRDFDKARDQVETNEKKKEREERKREKQASSQKNGRPPAYSSPAQPSKAAFSMVKASNHQPSMSSLLKELKSTPVPRHKVNVARDSQQVHQSPDVSGPDFLPRTTSFESHSYQSPTKSPSSPRRSVPHTPELPRVAAESEAQYQSSPDAFPYEGETFNESASTSQHQLSAEAFPSESDTVDQSASTSQYHASAEAFPSEGETVDQSASTSPQYQASPEAFPSEGEAVHRSASTSSDSRSSSLNSSPEGHAPTRSSPRSSITMTAMRAKARMRRARALRTHSAGPSAAREQEPEPVVVSGMERPSVSEAQFEVPTSAYRRSSEGHRSEANGVEQAPLSPRSNMRMKQRNRTRRSKTTL